MILTKAFTAPHGGKATTNIRSLVACSGEFDPGPRRTVKPAFKIRANRIQNPWFIDSHGSEVEGRNS
ncbi:hypothetical protein KL905_000463 [Ogataea polymorpha]|nr:hypothetical protein KL907_000647 [Ogataea polymorpha]KAG7924309.1 hypothetical protein KL905_000463 [Ogataea polymorpha]